MSQFPGNNPGMQPGQYGQTPPGQYQGYSGVPGFGTPPAPQPSPYGAPTAPHPTPYGALPTTHPGAAGPGVGYVPAPAATSYSHPAPAVDPLWTTFTHVAGTDQKIDAVELCKCLSQSGFTGSYKPFTQETCKIMIALLDRDRSGKMEFSEFKELWSVLSQWKQTFEQLDKDRSGSLDEQELKSAVLSFGYTLSPTALNVVMKRYNTNGKIYFDDFIALTIRIRSLSNFFISRDTHRQGCANLYYDDFMTHAMAC